MTAIPRAGVRALPWPLLAAAAAGAVAALTISAPPAWRSGVGLAAGVAIAAVAVASGPIGAAAVLTIAIYFPRGASVAGAVVSPPDLVVLLVLAFWLAAMMMRGHSRIARTAGDGPWVLMVSAAVISLAVGTLRSGEVPLGVGVREIGQLAVMFGGLYYWAASELSTSQRLRWAVGLFLGVSCAEAIYALAFQYGPSIASLSSVGFSYVERTTGTADAGFGAFMAAALVVAVALAGQTSWRWGTATKVVVIGVLLAGVLSTGTRGAALAAAVGVLFALIASRHRWPIIIGLLTAVAVVAITCATFPRLNRANRIAYRIGEPVTSGGIQRMIGWRLGLDIAARHPVWGAGPGANAAAFAVLSRAPSFVIDHVEGAFSAYIQALMETGPFGLLGLVGFIVLISGAAIRAYRRRPTAPSAPLTHACACGLVAVAVTGLTGPLIIAGVGHLFFLLAGLTAAGVRATEIESHAT